MKNSELNKCMKNKNDKSKNNKRSKHDFLKNKEKKINLKKQQREQPDLQLEQQKTLGYVQKNMNPMFRKSL